MSGWICPYCQTAQIVVSGQRGTTHAQFGNPISRYQAPGLRADWTACSNPDCHEIATVVTFGEGDLPKSPTPTRYAMRYAQIQIGALPKGQAKPRRAYVPEQIYEDYAEACAIRDLSPKAAATLVRRALQGMIRDFCMIAKATLAKEIEALGVAVSDGTAPPDVLAESVQAINHVRSLGNIGAHMEKDIGVIVAVDPQEAQLLIELIEMLFEEWYGSRARRAARLSAIQNLAVEKEAARSGEAGNRVASKA